MSSLQDLSLTVEDMRDNNYPIPAKYLSHSERKHSTIARTNGQQTKRGKSSGSIAHGFRSPDAVSTFGFIQTTSFDEEVDDEFYKVLAMDCEMCMTKNGLELTR